MPAPRKIYSAIGGTQKSARDQVMALGPSALDAPDPLSGQVLTWNGTAYVPMTAGAGGTTFLVKPPVTTGTYAATANEFVRVQPDGSLIPISVVLPLAASCPGKEIPVKRNAEVLTLVTVNASGADTIDGGSSFSMPTVAYFGVRFVSDGSQWSQV